MSVDGTDVVYKDIIEPLESASVTISKTDKSSVTDFGNPLEVANQILVPFLQHAWSDTSLNLCKMTNIVLCVSHLEVQTIFSADGIQSMGLWANGCR